MNNENISLVCEQIISEYKSLSSENYKQYLLNLLVHCKSINAELYKKTNDKRIFKHANQTESYIIRESVKKKSLLENISILTEKVLQYY